MKVPESLLQSDAPSIDWPSNLQPRQTALLYFGFGTPLKCTVSKVSFTKHGEVYYDVEVWLIGSQTARVHGVHSSFVLMPDSGRAKEAGSNLSDQKFTEMDIISFGNFMVGPERDSKPLPVGGKDSVTPADFDKWCEQRTIQY